MRLLGLLILIFLSNSLHAQSLADSVIHKYANDVHKVDSLLRIAASIQNKDYANCTRLCDEVIAIAKTSKDKKSEADATFLKGLTSYFAGEYQQTLQFYLSAIQLFEAAKYPLGKAKVNNELGIFYRRQQQDSLALAVFKDAYELAYTLDEKGVMATAINNQGILAQDQADHNKAIEYFKQAQTIYVQVQDSIGVSYTMDYASVSYAAIRRYQLATELQLKSLDIRLRFKDTNAAALSLYSLAEYESLQQHTTTSEKYWLQCIAIAEQIKYKDLAADCYKKLAALYASSGQSQKAYEYHVKYSNLNEELFNEKRSKQINELQTKYETSQRIQQIEILKKDNDVKESRQRIMLIIFLSVVLLLGLTMYTYLSYLRSKKQKEIDDAIIVEKELRSKSIIEAEEKERLRIARDLHDGVAQTMTDAKMQLEHFMDQVPEDSKLNDSLRNAFDLIKDAANEVRAVSHSMVPNALLKSGLVAAVRDFVHRMGSEKLKINLVVHGLKNRLDENIETVVYRVLQELVNNIIKHADATEITIQLLHEQTELHIMVEDNGRGFDINTLGDKAGMGLKNITSRVEYLNGHVHFDSSIGNGTTVMIDIPLENT
jgi:signal transduction histidine kinase